MKKLTIAIISIVFLLNMALAYNVTIKVNGIGLKDNDEAGEIIQFETIDESISGWEVKTENTTITNNQFTMPSGDVEIEGIVPVAKYALTIDFPTFTKIEEKVVGTPITVSASNGENGEIFSGWTAIGIVLTDIEKSNMSVTFSMPANPVSLIANYTEPVKTYKISYDANGGSGAPSTQIKAEEIGLTLSSEIPIRTGY